MFFVPSVEGSILRAARIMAESICYAAPQKDFFNSVKEVCKIWENM